MCFHKSSSKSISVYVCAHILLRNNYSGCLFSVLLATVNLLNMTSMLSIEGRLPITLAEVANVDKKLQCGRALWIDGIHPEMLKAFLGLSWLTHLFSSMSHKGVEGQTWFGGSQI